MFCRALCIVVLMALTVEGAEVNRSWDVLGKIIRQDSKVVVTRMDGEKVEGKLLGITSESITVKKRNQPRVVPKEEVRRVRYADIRMRNTLLGLAIGIGGGAAIGAIAPRTNRDLGALFGMLNGAWIGPIVGGVLPIGKPLYEVSRVAGTGASGGASQTQKSQR